MSLIHPSDTYMDLNIGIALWLASGGDGCVDGSKCHMQDGSRYNYRNALDEEMRLDVQRIWKRNMGRDDRCISDHGKEARFPFLDENVIKTLLKIPLWDIAKLEKSVGKGDKVLREVARLLGLHEAALQPKRAIQFGSRIARESNRKKQPGSKPGISRQRAGSLAYAMTVRSR